MAIFNKVLCSPLTQPEAFPGAENYYARCISLPLFPNLSDEQQAFVIDTVKEATK